MNADTDARPIDSRQTFVAALDSALELVLARRARRLVWADADFTDWPLDDPAVLRRLVEWLRLPQRRCVLLAAEPEALRRRARFMDCYRLWSHAIGVYAPAPDDASELPCLLWAEGVVLVQVLDKRHWRGRCGQAATELRVAGEGLDALLQRSKPALPVTVLGL